MQDVINILPPGQKVTPFIVWSIYSSVNLHFKTGSKYNAFKYHFQRKPTQKWDIHGWLYAKIAKQYQTRNRVLIWALANVLEGNTFIMNTTEDAYDRWCARIQRLNYTFNSDISTLRDSGYTFDALLKSNSGILPIYKIYLNGEILLETLVMIDYLTGFSGQARDPLGVGEGISSLLHKYRPFISSHIDTIKCKNKILEMFSNKTC